MKSIPLTIAYVLQIKSVLFPTLFYEIDVSLFEESIDEIEFQYIYITDVILPNEQSVGTLGQFIKTDGSLSIYGLGLCTWIYDSKKNISRISPVAFQTKRTTSLAMKEIVCLRKLTNITISVDVSLRYHAFDASKYHLPIPDLLFQSLQMIFPLDHYIARKEIKNIYDYETLLTVAWLFLNTFDTYYVNTSVSKGTVSNIFKTCLKTTKDRAKDISKHLCIKESNASIEHVFTHLEQTNESMLLDFSPEAFQTFAKNPTIKQIFEAYLYQPYLGKIYMTKQKKAFIQRVEATLSKKER